MLGLSILLNNISFGAEYSDIGDPIIECVHYGALIWHQERTNKNKHTTMPKYQLYCGNGKVQLSFIKTHMLLLQHLFFNNNEPDNQKYQNISIL